MLKVRGQWKHPKSQVSSFTLCTGCFPVNMSWLHNVPLKRRYMLISCERGNNDINHIQKIIVIGKVKDARCGFWNVDHRELRLCASLAAAAARMGPHSVCVRVNHKSSGAAFDVTWKRSIGAALPVQDEASLKFDPRTKKRWRVKLCRQ